MVCNYLLLVPYTEHHNSYNVRMYHLNLANKLQVISRPGYQCKSKQLFFGFGSYSRGFPDIPNLLHVPRGGQTLAFRC